MWPAAFWEKAYEPIIRRAAGLGRAGYEADPDRYEKLWAHCDLLVVGAGPAGLDGRADGRRGQAPSVFVADENAQAGRRTAERRSIYCRRSRAGLRGHLARRARSAAQCAADAADDGVWLVRRHGVRRGRARLGHSWRRRRPAAARAALAHRRATRHPGHRSGRAAAGVSWQRPSGRV